MRILLSGSGGLLGSALMAVAQTAGFSCDPLRRPEMAAGAGIADVLAEMMSGYDLVIHAAANTNVEQCEVAPDECYRDNFLLTEAMAIAAVKAGVRLIYISSTGLYGTAETRPYREYDIAVPTTHHHRSKYLAEQIVMSSNVHNLVVRTGWLFGGSVANPKNFVARRIDEARAALLGRGYIESNTEQRGVPCFSEDIARRVLLLATTGLTGIFNCVNASNASRYEYVSKIIELASITIEVLPSSAVSFNRKAQVSNNEMAENWKMTSLGMAVMPFWQDSLASYIHNHLLRIAEN